MRPAFFRIKSVPSLIMNLFVISMISVAISISQTPVANAKTVHLNRSVRSGKSVKIDTYQGWNNNCSHKTINIDIVTKPKAGRASAKIVNSRISVAQAGSVGKCAGRKIRGLAVYYRSKSGYRGRDRVKIKMKVAGQPPVYFVYRINVR